MGTGTRAAGAGGRLPAQNKGCGGGAQRGRGRASLALRRERRGRGAQRSAPRQRDWGLGSACNPSRCQRGLRGGHSSTELCGPLNSQRWQGSLPEELASQAWDCHDPVLG